MTFNNTLENIDDKYYWFLSEENGLDIIKKDRVITMVCEPSKLRLEYTNKFVIRVIPNTQIETIIQYGSVKLDAKLRRNEYIFKTNLNSEDVFNLPFVLSVKSL